jgi:hypothetical protein
MPGQGISFQGFDVDGLAVQRSLKHSLSFGAARLAGRFGVLPPPPAARVSPVLLRKADRGQVSVAIWRCRTLTPDNDESFWQHYGSHGQMGRFGRQNDFRAILAR